MKKLMLLASAAAVVLAGCSEDEMKDVSRGHAIDFRVGTASRATEITGSNITNFYVTAYKGTTPFFTDVEFSRPNTTQTFFESMVKYYWPKEGDRLDFVAYSPSAEVLPIQTDKKAVPNFSPKLHFENQYDFIYATASGTKDNNADGVQLNFKHALSQVVIQAKHEGNNVVKVAGVKIVGAINGGSFDFSTTTPKWTLGSEKDTPYKVTYDEMTLGAEATSLMNNEVAMLVPQQLTAWDKTAENTNGGAYIAVKVNIHDASGQQIYPYKSDESWEGKYGWVAVPIDTKWEAGKKYVYTLDFQKGTGLVAPVPTEGSATDPIITDDDIDPKDPDAPEKTETEETQPGGDQNDPETPKPGQAALGDPIKFTVTVSNWDVLNNEPSMRL